MSLQVYRISMFDNVMELTKRQGKEQDMPVRERNSCM